MRCICVLLAWAGVRRSHRLRSSVCAGRCRRHAQRTAAGGVFPVGVVGERGFEDVEGGSVLEEEIDGLILVLGPPLHPPFLLGGPLLLDPTVRLPASLVEVRLEN